ncbi:MAG: Pentapeptide repeats (8 copies) [Alphaproteobacteria bacterium ADurb.Bin438]|nr:MAG: Pentapeptide repeats (8 copies) [Alphaproteobacteria bacterium ADurb.Bin438]
MNKDGKELLGPDGKPLTDTSDYKLSEDGKEVVGPDGKVYRVDEEGKYVGPDGRAVIGQDGAPVGPEGAVDPELAKQAALNAKANEMMKDPRYQDLLEENKKLRADKGVEDDLIDEEINSDKYLTKEQIASLVCNPSACKTSLDTKQSFEELLDGAIKTLENKKADIASRLNAICTAKCVSVNERKLEEKAITSLAKYVRRRVPWILTPNPEPEIETKSVRPDVQAALVAIAGKERSDNIGSVIDLTAVDLRGADLSQANLKNVDLSFSNLATTNLKNAKGLTRWDSIRLVVIDETTLIPESISAGYVVRRRPNIMPLEAGSFKVVTEDWISWKSILVNGQK